jgi:hypothetical protein
VKKHYQQKQNSDSEATKAYSSDEYAPNFDINFQTTTKTSVFNIPKLYYDEHNESEEELKDNRSRTQMQTQKNKKLVNILQKFF